MASELLLHWTDSTMSRVTTQQSQSSEIVIDQNNNDNSDNVNENNSTPIVSHFVMNYGDRSIFSQSFIARIDSQLPFMNNQTDVLMTIQILYSYINQEIEKILRLRNHHIK